jgi:hypothetical protein
MVFADKLKEQSRPISAIAGGFIKILPEGPCESRDDVLMVDQRKEDGWTT